jgi:hypothetical protein
MAQRFWLLVISLQVTLSIAVAVAVLRASPETNGWLGIPITAATFVLLQYFLIALTILVSRTLAGERMPRDLVQVMHVALSEPIYFGLAQFSMICGRQEHQSATARRQVVRAHRAPLVLVHGLACNRGIWRWLIPALRAAGFGSIYAVDLQPLHANIDLLARQLTRELGQIVREHEGSSVTIISHSLGGLIARAALAVAPPQTIRRIITIGTPHHGAAIARALSWRPARQMYPGSPWLAALNTLQEGRLSIALTSVCGVDDNLVQPASSSHLQGATTHEIHGLGHFGLVISRRAVECVVGCLESAA